MSLGDEVPQLKPVGLAQGVVHDDQLDLHLFRQDVFDVDTYRLPGRKAGAALRKPRKVRRNLHKGAVFLHAAHNAHHRFAHGEPGGVLCPCAQQLPDGQHKAPLRVPVLDGAQDLLSYADPVGRGGDAAYRHTVDGQQGTDTTAHVTKRAERLDVGHGTGQDIPGRKGVQILRLAQPLRLGAGKPVAGRAVLVRVQPLDDKTGGASHPGQHRNIPHGTGFGTVCALGKGHHRLYAAQLKPQLPPGVKGKGSGL